jgi:hypothetical protein
MDDPNNVLVNAALVAMLVPVLTAIGQVLKGVPALRSVPEWLPLLNVLIGIGIAVAYTFARANTAGVPPTAMELLLAVIAGVMAGQLSARVYDAAYTSLSRSKGATRAARLMRTTPHPPRG